MKDKDTVAIIIPTYNMPEATLRLEQDIRSRIDWPFTLIIVENGSTEKYRYRPAIVQTRVNLQTTLGIQLGLDYARIFEKREGRKFGAIWLMTTSVKFPPESTPLTRLMEIKNSKYSTVAVSPAWIGGDDNSPTHNEMLLGSIKQMGDRPLGSSRRTWIGGLNTLWERDFLMDHFELCHELTYSWGVDYLLSWYARSQEKKLYVHEGVIIEVEKDAGYNLNRMGMTAAERAKAARNQMNKFFYSRFGDDWEKEVRTQYTYSMGWE